MRILRNILDHRKKVRLLQQKRWYRNMVSGWVHPRCLAILSLKDVLLLSYEEVADICGAR